MRLLVYSWFPVLASHMIGGAQQAMHDLLLGFSRHGIAVTVICPEITKNNHELLSVNNIHILPVLKEVKGRPLFPYEYAYNLKQVAEAAKNVDIVWTLDYSFPIQVSQPIVLTLDNFTYAEEMTSLLDLNWDLLVVPSRYLQRIAEAVVGPEYWEGIPRPIRVIPYAVDTATFTHTSSDSLCKKLGLSQQDRYLLFPHRPDPNKGFDIALQTIQRLCLQGWDYKLLIPVNETYKEDMRYYEKLRTRAMEMGIGSSIVLHRWIDLDDLAAYYSLGIWTLALGIFPEGFGLTPVQSISCGTPVISTRAGALDDQFPPGNGVMYVDFNAVEQVVSHISNGIPMTEVEQGQKFIRENYSIENLVQDHLRCFAQAEKNSAHFNPLRKKSQVRISPWCHLLDRSHVWHDYRMRAYKLSKKESDLLTQIEQGVSARSLTPYNEQLSKLLDQGILVGDLAS